ncbi:hypothetical protein AB0C40_21380 [Streptomyces brevispora]|uniref:hypothetical protein n=1 Tax=Streptomyces brevispora TaxID=887462 RepID=UPI003401A917
MTTDGATTAGRESGGPVRQQANGPVRQQANGESEPADGYHDMRDWRVRRLSGFT